MPAPPSRSPKENDVNATHSPHLSTAENDFLQHMMRFGSDGYPIQKIKRSWHWMEFWGVKCAPTVYKTKREAMAAVERYVDILVDRVAGRFV